MIDLKAHRLPWEDTTSQYALIEWIGRLTILRKRGGVGSAGKYIYNMKKVKKEEE